MNGLRLTLITRRFWPLVGGAEMMISNLAVELLGLGAIPSIVTARWETHWPEEIVHREVPVRRLPNPRQRGWGTLRYMSQLHRHLRKQARHIDAVCVSMLKHDAYAAVRAFAGGSTPVILRAEGGGLSGDAHWQQSARFGRRIGRRCRQADAIVAPSPAIKQELLHLGYAEDCVRYIPNGVTVPDRIDRTRRAAAREALAEVNCDLYVESGAPVALYTGRLDKAKGLLELIDAWARVAAVHTNARLWLCGEGPDRDVLWERIAARELRGRVLLPGCFDSVEGLLQAADLFVLPSHAEGLSLSLLEAMAVGLPAVATDIPGNRTLVEHGVTGLLVPLQASEALSGALLAMLNDPDLAGGLAQAAHRRVQEHYDVRRVAKAHLDLIAEMAGRRKASR